jgi:hypothetical protein
VTGSDRLSLGLVVAAMLCCATPVLVGTGLAAAALAGVRQHWGWVATGIGLVAFAVLLRRRRTGHAAR